MLAAVALLFGSWADPATTNEGPGVFILKATPPHAAVAAARGPAKVVSGRHQRVQARFRLPVRPLAGADVGLPGVGRRLVAAISSQRPPDFAAQPSSGRAPPAPAC